MGAWGQFICGPVITLMVAVLIAYVHAGMYRRLRECQRVMSDLECAHLRINKGDWLGVRLVTLIFLLLILHATGHSALPLWVFVVRIITLGTGLFGLFFDPIINRLIGAPQHYLGTTSWVESHLYAWFGDHAWALSRVLLALVAICYLFTLPPIFN